VWGTPQKKRAAARIRWGYFATGPILSTPNSDSYEKEADFWLFRIKS